MKTDYLQSTIDSYNINSKQYITLTDSMILTPEVEQFVHLVPQKTHILDAGCGYGKYVKVFVEKGFRVTGIDLSEGLLEEAKNFEPRGDYSLMDVRDVKFAENSFSAVWCIATLLHLTPEDIGVALKELYRVLKKDGILFVTFKEGKGSKIVQENFAGERKRFFTFINIKQMKKFLTDAGFSILSVEKGNERERFGAEYRDQNWIEAFAKK